MTELQRVNWPADLDRTPSEERRRWQGTSGTCRSRAKRIISELDVIGASNIDLQTNMEHIHNEPNIPAIDGGDPPDPAAVVRFELSGEQCCIAADEGRRVKDNLRAIGDYVETQKAAHVDNVPPQVFQTVHVGVDLPF